MTKMKIEIAEARRKKIEELIQNAKIGVKVCRSASMGITARLLDDLADVAEQYLKEVVCPQNQKGRDAQGLRHGAYTKPEKTRHYGEDNGSAKLSSWDVICIRKLRDTGQTYRQLAFTFHVSQSQIGNIIRGQSWRHL